MASIFSPFSLSLSISPLHILTLIKRFNNDSKQSITAGLISSFHACTHSFALPRKRLRTRKDKAYTLGCRCLCMHAPGEKKNAIAGCNAIVSFLCVFLDDCGLIFLSGATLDCDAVRRKKRESNRHEGRREREVGDTGERENQRALTQRQSISSLLSLFPMGWPQ